MPPVNAPLDVIMPRKRGKTSQERKQPPAPLKKIHLAFLIEYRVTAENINLEDVLEHLRGTGAADIINVEVREGDV